MKTEIESGMVQIMSIGITIIGITNIFSYFITRDNIVILSGGVMMPLTTAIAITMSGVCLMLLSLRVERNEKRK